MQARDPFLNTLACPATVAFDDLTSMTYNAAPDLKLDLSFVRQVDVPKALIWRAWSEPDLLKRWFCPKPWLTTECEMDLRPGGLFKTLMQSPEGDEFPNVGCFLDVQVNHRLVWTNALGPGFRPNQAHSLGVEDSHFFFTATIELQDHLGGTRYFAGVQHADERACNKHRDMGFEQGWGLALEQMVDMINQGI